MVEGTRRHVRHLVRHPPFVSGPPLRRHVLDPRKRKSSIISRPSESGFSCSHWSIFSMTTSRSAWPSTVSCPPESGSFAGQAGLSHSLAYQNTPKRVLDRFPSQGPQVPPPVGKPEWPAPPVNRSTAGHWGVVAIRSRPTVPRPPAAQEPDLRRYGPQRLGPMVEAWATVFRPAVFPWPAHTVQCHPMSSISI